MPKNIILASASPRRKKLLKKITKDFFVVSSGFDEKTINEKKPIKFAAKASYGKAMDVALKNKENTVIGADTIVVLDKKILGKPKNIRDAFFMLKNLSGRRHEVITGISVVNIKKKKIKTWHEKTFVFMKNNSDETILNYLNSKKPLDKAGAYGIQEIGGLMIDKIIGDYDNVVGLPLKRLKKVLSKFA